MRIFGQVKLWVGTLVGDVEERVGEGQQRSSEERELSEESEQEASQETDPREALDGNYDDNFVLKPRRNPGL